MLTIDPAAVMENCGPEINLTTLTTKLWWPGCGFVSDPSDPRAFDTCGLPCFSGSLVQDMRAFNLANGGVKVTYTSRAQAGIETVQLGGWWLPPISSPASAPRIVLQHGFTENSNKVRVQFAAYLLRKAGFGVLLNNYRDACYSGQSSAHIYEWGNAYPFDVLGAWDFAVNDFTGALGGSRSPSQVGLMGFSMGAFNTVNAFGLEPQAPAAWVDSPPFQPRIVFANGCTRTLKGMGLGPVASSMVDTAWNTVLRRASDKGVDLNRNLPENTLPRGPDAQRPIYWVGNRGDATVPHSEGQKLIDLVNSLPAKYKLAGTWSTDGFCDGVDHCVDHLRAPVEYFAKLCSFWQAVFNKSMASCS